MIIGEIWFTVPTLNLTFEIKSEFPGKYDVSPGFSHQLN